MKHPIDTESQAMAVRPIMKSKAAIKRASAATGNVAVDIGNYTKCKQIGEVIQECGVLNVGLGMYSFSKDKLEEAISKYAGLMLQTDEPETAVLVGQLVRQLINSYNDTASNIIKSVPASTGPVSINRPVVFPPNSVVTATVKVKSDNDETKAAIDI